MSERISEALREEDGEQLINRVKSAVAEQILSVDASAKVQLTDYFNHSYIPDLVLKWNGDERGVYLRRSTLTYEVADDVDRLGSSGPLFFGLEARAPDSPEETQQVAEATAAKPNVLVTESEAIDELAHPGSGIDALLGSIGRTVLKGGRGLLREEQARGLAESADRLVGAGIGNADLTALDETLALWGGHLQSTYFDDLKRILAYVWVLSGGDPSLAPEALDKSAAISQDDLARLLRHLFSMGTTIEDVGFWRRVGDDVSLETFELIGSQRPHPNLHRLIQANSGRITASWVDIARWTRELSRSFTWEISDGFLCLASGLDVSMRFAVSGDRLARSAPTPGPQMSELQARLGNRALTSLTTESGEVVASIRSRDAQSDPSEEFERLLQALGESSRVSKAEVRLAAMKAVVDFSLRRIHLPSSLTVRRFASEAAVVFGMPDEGHIELEEFLYQGAFAEPTYDPDVDADPGQATLFD